MEEKRILLRNRGKINPEKAEEYIERGGYKGLEKVLGMEGKEIIEELARSGLRGRGGAGFPTFRKLQFAYDAPGDVKYIVCNADEGEPGTNKDRILLSSDPCAVFEGMAIAGKAVNAHVGFIYLRAEYSYLVPILEAAIKSSCEANMLGKISREAVLILKSNSVQEQAPMSAVKRQLFLNPLKEKEGNQDSGLRSRE